MEIEHEAKLLAADAGALDRLASLESLDGVGLGPAAALDEVDRYVDTDDGRLAARRWACRIRTRGTTTIVSLKGPASPGDGAGIHRRPEVEGPTDGTDDPDRWPASPARDLVDELRHGRPLLERFRLEQRRVERPMELDARPIGVLSLDHVTVRRGDRHAGTFHVAELELRPDAVPGPSAAVDLLRRLVVAAASFGGLEPDPSTKLERAVALLER
jgi:inorganic triphosphatase YgiF